MDPRSNQTAARKNRPGKLKEKNILIFQNSASKRFIIEKSNMIKWRGRGVIYALTYSKLKRLVHREKTPGLERVLLHRTRINVGVVGSKRKPATGLESESTETHLEKSLKPIN